MIADYRRKGWNTDKLMVDLQKRFALPAAVFVFALLGIPLGIQKVRSAKLTGFTMALGVVIVYYILFKTLEAVGEDSKINPILAIWLPNIIMGTLGLYFFRLALKDSENRVLARASDVTSIVSRRLRRYVGVKGERR